MIRQIDIFEFSSKHLGILVNEFVDRRKNIKFKATGGSMFPIIRDGDIITISPYIDNKPEVGDMVAFVDSNTRNLIVHRIIRLSSKRFISKGDSCFNKDRTQFLSNILGYVSDIDQNSAILNYKWIIKCKRIVVFFSLVRFNLVLSMLTTRLKTKNSDQT